MYIFTYVCKYYEIAETVVGDSITLSNLLCTLHSRRMPNYSIIMKAGHFMLSTILLFNPVLSKYSQDTG